MSNFNKVAEIEFSKNMSAKDKHEAMDERMLKRHAARMRKLNALINEDDGSGDDYKESYKASIVDAAFGRLPC